MVSTHACIAATCYIRANSGFSEKELYNCFAGRRLVNVESWASLMNFVVVQGG
jgi:hypothetical protein